MSFLLFLETTGEKFPGKKRKKYRAESYFWISPSCCYGNTGCFFSPPVCEIEEECFDDNVFGRCQIPYGTDVDIYTHRLATETLQLLERELARLIAGGYRWAHDYAQCVIQNILYTSRHQISYDPGLCSRVMQFTLPEVPPDILSELESPEPDELAFIK
ncbi:uncharacterized protein TNCV_790751 [Trichonephila clavipes]|nr:uncharacterized protein TNCV_790751 [Trichonephila clavipes]